MFLLSFLFLPFKSKYRFDVLKEFFFFFAFHTSFSPVVNNASGSTRVAGCWSISFGCIPGCLLSAPLEMHSFKAFDIYCQLHNFYLSFERYVSRNLLCYALFLTS